MKWINPKTGELERRPPGVLHSHVEDYQALPVSVREWLDKSRHARWGDLPMVKASGVGWRDVLTPRRVLVADGTQVASTTSETIMCPDFTFAADHMEPGDSFKYTVLFSWSSVITTPGTFTFRLRWGGVGGTALATSGAYAPDPTAGGTSISGMVEYWLVTRSTGTAGSMFAMGRLILQDFDDASATTLKGNLDMLMIPVSAPAAVGSLDTTTAKALSPTVQFTVSGATTNLTSHIATLESLN